MKGLSYVMKGVFEKVRGEYGSVIGMALFVLVIALIWWNAKYQDSTMVRTVEMNKDGSAYLSEIVDGESVSQTFCAPGYNINSISIAVVTFGKEFNDENTFIVRAFLREKEGEVLTEWDISATELVDNSTYTLYLDEKVEVGEEYELILQTEGAYAGNSFSVRTSEKNSYVGGTLTVNGENMERDICFSVEVSEAKFISLFYWGMTVVIMLVYISIMLLVIKWKAKGIEYKYALMVVCIGTIYMFLLPPMSTPDEQYHFMCANKVANILTSTSTEGGNYGWARKEDIASMKVIKNVRAINYYNFYCNDSGIDNSEKNSILKYALPLEPDAGPAYWAPGLTVAICRFLQCDGRVLILLGAWTNLLFYSVIIFYAIRIIPFGKNTLGIISLIPMMISTLASYSYDVFQMAMTCIFFAISMKYIYADNYKITKKEWLIYCIVTALFVPIKAIYISFLLLVFAIPSERWNSRKKEYVSKCGIFVFTILVMVTTKLDTMHNKIEIFETNNLGVQQNSLKLKEIGHMWANTVVTNASFYVKSMFGSLLSWLNIPISDGIIIGFAVVLIIAALMEKSTIEITCRQYIYYRIVLITGLLAMLFLATILWTERETGILIGIQGRYFIPYLLFVPFVIKGVIKNKEDVSNKLIYYAMVLHTFAFYEIMHTTLITK